MALSIVQQAAADRLASGASTKNTALTPAAPVVAKPITPPTNPSAGDISQAFKGSAQFQPAPQNETYIPSTKQTYTGQAAVTALQNAGGSTSQVAQAQQQVNQQAAPQTANQSNTQKPNSQFTAQAAQQTQQNLNPTVNPQASPQQQALAEMSLNKGVQSPRDAFATQQAYDQYQTRLNGNGPQYTNQNSQNGVNSTVSSQSTPSTTTSPNNSTAPPPTTPPGNLPPNSPSQTTQVSSQVPVQTPGQTMIQHTDSSGQTTMMSPDDAHQTDINTSLSNAGNQSMNDGLHDIMSAPPGTSAAEILKQNLVTELGMIDDPKVNQILDNSAQRAKSSYDAGMAMTQTSLDEISKAIDGTLEAPSTAAGIQAKIYKQNETQQQASLANETTYQDQTHQNQMDQLRDNRSRLEGYSKAKLESMGQLDSSAGITLLSKMNQSADLQIQQADLDYGHAHQQLVLQGNQVINDYTNQVSQLTQQTNAQKATYLKDFNDTMSGIQDKELASDQEKNKLTITAFSNYNDKVAALTAQQKQQQFDYMKFAYDQHKDLIDQSYKLSGMMGTVYMPDANGQLQNTGMPTFDNTKNQQDYMLKVAGYNLDVGKANTQQQQFAQTYALDTQKTNIQLQDSRRNAVNDFFTQAKASGYDPKMGIQLAQMLGLKEDTFSQYGNNLSAVQNAAQTQMDTTQNQNKKIQANEPQITSSPECDKVFRVGQVGGQCGDYASTISTASHVGNTWNEKKTHIDHTDNPQPGDKLLIPMGAKTDGTGYGHVAVVTGYDPNTGNINVVESNMKPPYGGVVSHGSYTMSGLQQKYPGFGFASGQLKPQIQSQLSSLAPEQTQISTYTPPQANSQGGNMLASLTGGNDMFSDANIISMFGAARNSMVSQNTQEAFLKNWQDPTSPNSGSSQKNAINNALQHLGEAYKAYSAMGQAGIKDANGARDYFATHASDPALAGYMAIKGDAASEVAKAILGGTPGKEELDAEVKTLSQDQSPEEMMQTIQAKMKLMGGRAQTLAQNYQEAMGVMSPAPILNGEAQKAVSSLGLDPADMDPVLKAEQADPGNIRANLSTMIQGRATVPQIITSLQQNPTTKDYVNSLLSQVTRPEDYQDIINQFLQ